MHDEEDARARLTRFAEQLRKLSFPTSPISCDLAKFVADAFDRYLSGEFDSLDAAFGLIPKRGRPKDLERHEAIARSIFAMRLEGKSWIEITDEFVAQRVTDDHSLRRIYREFRVKLMAEEIDRRWADDGGHKSR